MKEKKIPKDIFVSQAKNIEIVLQRAVKDAVLTHKKFGKPVAIWKDGKVVIVPPEEILIEEKGNDLDSKR